MKYNRFLAFTWGLPMCIIGLPVYVILTLAKCEKGYVYIDVPIPYFVVPFGDGGLEFGFFYVVSKDYSLMSKKGAALSEKRRLNLHEIGHCVQNCYYGIFYLPLWLLGFVWYGLWKLVFEKRGYVYETPFWEYQATSIGYRQ